MATGGFFQGPGTWPAADAPGPSFPAQGGMPGMLPPQTMSAGPMPSGPFPPSPPQPFAFNPAAGDPFPAGPPAAPATPAETPQDPLAMVPQGETGKPRFDLGFDPTAKDILPFELPGDNELETGPPPAAGPPHPRFP